MDAPPEWHLRRATLKAPNGEILCDTDVNDLYVVNYSESCKGTFSRGEIMKHIHSIDHLSDAIPYVTSYYKRTWWFCFPHRIKVLLA